MKIDNIWLFLGLLIGGVILANILSGLIFNVADDADIPVISAAAEGYGA